MNPWIERELSDLHPRTVDARLAEAQSRADRQYPVCLKWFMTKAQRDHHVTIRHP